MNGLDGPLRVQLDAMSAGSAGLMAPAGLGARACVRNTFLEFEEEDPWLISDKPRRLQTDSIVERSSQAMRLDLDFHHKALGSATGHVPANSYMTAARADTPAVIPTGPPPTPFCTPLAMPEVAAAAAKVKAAGGGAWSPRSVPVQDQGPQQVGDVLQEEEEEYEEYEEDDEEYEEEEPEPAPATVEHDFQRQQETAGAGWHQSVDGSDGLSTSRRNHVDKEALAARDLALRGGGLSGNTTVMIRHIPGKYTQQKLMREINSAGFLGKYDFFYLPVQPQSRGNRGFAFVNFCTPEAAEEFYSAFHDRRLRHFHSGQAVAVVPADLQGFERNATHYASMRSHRNRRPMQTGRALFFKPLPAHLLDDGEQPEPATVPLPAAAPGWKVPTESAAAVAAAALSVGRLQSPWHASAAAAAATAAPAAPIVQRFCAYCGQPKLPEHVFCRFCGARALP